MLKKTTTTTWIPSVKNTLLLVNVNHHLIRQGRHKSSSCTKKKKITVSAKHNKAKHKKRKNVYFASSIQYNDQEKNSESKADRLKRKNLKCLAWHMTSPALSCAVLSHSVFATPWTAARQAPLSLGFSRQEYWSGLLRPPPGHLPDPGIKPTSLVLQVDCLPSEPPGKTTDNANWPQTKSSKTNEFINYTG